MRTRLILNDVVVCSKKKKRHPTSNLEAVVKHLQEPKAVGRHLEKTQAVVNKLEELRAVANQLTDKDESDKEDDAADDISIIDNTIYRAGTKIGRASDWYANITKVPTL